MMRSEPKIDVRVVPATTIYPLRHKVLRPNRPFADAIWAQDNDPDTAHFAAVADGAVIGIASMAICPRDGDPPNTWRLRGMATEPQWRGKGVGARVLVACLDHVRSHGGTAVWCNARTGAAGFYRKYGFETVGEEFEIPGVGPHFVMICKL